MYSSHGRGLGEFFLTITQSIIPTKLLSWQADQKSILEWKLYIWEQAQPDPGSTNVLYEQILSAFDILSLFSQPIFITSL